jgi:hypothetical protein
MDYGSEHLRFYIFVEAKRGKTATEIHSKCKESGITDLPHFTTVWRWWESFKNESRTSLQNQPRTSCPRSATTAENIELVNRLIKDMPKQSARMIASDTGLTKDAIHNILRGELGLRKVCSTWVPHQLSDIWWQHDNARPHAAVHTKEFISRRKITLITQSPYSPDLNQCDRWINREIKEHFRHHNYQSAEEIVEESLRFLRSIPRQRFEKELKRLENHCRDVLACNGDYVA